MEKMRWLCALILVCVFGFLTPCLEQPASARSSQRSDEKQSPTFRKMDITGQIVKGSQGYIIQGRVPKEVFPILNPNPSVLDRLADGRTVHIEALIVLGDNVKIEKIDGKAYQENPGAPEKQ